MSALVRSALGLPNGLLGEELQSWLSHWSRRRGRAPRILHIGNIANNAYNNAKLLRKAGFDCDVICYDYYHIMGCPEWEDADFEGDVADHFHPDWTELDLRGFERPRWFVQGPADACIAYLLARYAGSRAEADAEWAVLERLNRTKANHPRNWRIWRRQLANDLRDRLLETLSPGALEARLYAWRERMATGMEWLVGQCRDMLPRGLVTRWLGTTPRYLLERLSRLLRVSMNRMIRGFLAGYRLGIRGGKFVVAVVRARLEKLHASPPPGAAAADVIKRLKGLYAEAFPERPDRLSTADLQPVLFYLERWRALFAHYDIILGYSTDPILPLAVGRRYFALEHGTLREIPFARNARGRTTALAYHHAEHAFVTNYDCLRNAERLCGQRHSFINHPYDEDHGLSIAGVDELRQRLERELDADFLVFFPTRHDWVAGTGYADKANDEFLRAFAALCHEGHRLGMVCCRWGRNVEASRALLAASGCAARVHWVEPMGIVRFERMAQACDVVADQFMLGAFGGVTFKALAAAVPVCTFIEPSLLDGLFAELPPVVNCRTEAQIREGLRALVEDRARLVPLRQASRDWIKRYHSGREVVEKQVRQFKLYLEAEEAEADRQCRAS